MDDSLIKRPFFSVAIPTWEIAGKGAEYLDHSFNILAQQTFKDFEIVVSDHSFDNSIRDVCFRWKDFLDVGYFKNSRGRGKIAPNLNSAIKNCGGKYIKILFQDDFLYDINSLEIIHESILKNPDNRWFVTACVHTRDCVTVYDKMVPRYHDRIHEGINTISCPTVLTIKNENPMLFDESLNWLVDVEYYKRLYDNYGLPIVIDSVCAVNRDSEVRTTTMITEQAKEREVERMKKSTKIKLEDVTIIGVAGTKAVETLKAIKYSCKGLDFAEAKLITPEDLQDDYVQIIKCEPLNYEQYNHFIVYRLHEYVQTKHCLLVQNDGYVVNPGMWDPEFLDYDYIGAPWHLPKDDFSFRDPEGNICRVGNGGFSLRSKKLLELATKIDLEWKPYFGYYHEDGFFCCHNRKEYESNGCKFAPVELAARFSHETQVPETAGIVPFGFHGRNHPYYNPTQKNMK